MITYSVSVCEQESPTLVELQRDYSVDFFNSIPDYWDVKQQAYELEALAPTLGEIICRHGLHAIFGVSLLHRHFALNEGERLIRTHTTRRFSVAVGREIGTERSIPYMWALQTLRDGRSGWVPIEFCDGTHSTRLAVAPHAIHVERRLEFFDEFGQTLRDRGLVGMVALTALFQRSQFELAPGETLFEETNDRQRLITLRVAAEEEVGQRNGDTIKTLWMFSPSYSLVSAARCASHCYGHCKSH